MERGCLLPSKPSQVVRQYSRQMSVGESGWNALSCWRLRSFAKVAELADAPDLGSGGETRGGSSPPFRTKNSGSEIWQSGRNFRSGIAVSTCALLSRYDQQTAMIGASSQKLQAPKNHRAPQNYHSSKNHQTLKNYQARGGSLLLRACACLVLWTNTAMSRD